MKKILISGANSYIGTNIEKWLNREPHKYHLQTLDTMDPNWKKYDFVGYDVVFHVAGIAHRKEKSKLRDLYNEVNFQLVKDTFIKAKNSNVKLFIFMSSMSVYGLNHGYIDLDTQCKPNTLYGKSKLKAEEFLLGSSNNLTKVCILRPPIIYGRNSPGNFAKMIRFLMKIRIFPKSYGKRSMLYVGNLAKFVEYCINNDISGIQHPQDNDYMKVSSIISVVSSEIKKNIYTIPYISIILKYLKPKLYYKIFDDLCYDRKLSLNVNECNFISNIKALKISIKRK